MAPALQDVRLVGLLLAFMLNIGLLIYLRPFALSSPENIKSVLHSLGGLGRLENLRYKSAFQLDPPSEDAPHGAVVLAGNQSDPISWLLQLEPKYATLPRVKKRHRVLSGLAVIPLISTTSLSPMIRVLN